MGDTLHLFEIYGDAGKKRVELGDEAAERLLGQALFVGDNPEKYADLFLDYYEYGANRVLVKAFLGFTAYEYLVGRCGIADGILEKVKKEALSEDNHIMILTMLKYYSGQDKYTEAEREYIGHHLSRYVSTGKVFEFMKGFVGKIEVPFEIEYAELIQCCSSQRKGLYIEFTGDAVKQPRQPMRQVFTDIYIYETLLFRGEKLSYQIYAGDGETLVEEGMRELGEAQKAAKMKEPEEHRVGEPIFGDGVSAFYELVNEMIDVRDKKDQERFNELVKQYKLRRGIADKIFTPL